MPESLTSAGWQRIDERLHLGARLARGDAIYVDADDIKSISGREPPTLDRVCEWIESSTRLTGATPRRRALTVLAWARWAAEVTAVSLDGEDR